MASPVSFKEKFFDAPLEAVNDTAAFQTWTKLVTVADHGAEAAFHSTLSLADYRTYLNLVRGIGQASAWVNYVLLGPGTLEDRSPKLAHPLQTCRELVQKEADAIVGGYLDMQTWKSDPIKALDSLAVNTGAALPQGVLLAYGLAPQMAAFETQNVVWAQRALHTVERGFDKMVPPAMGIKPSGAMAVIPVAGVGEEVVAIVGTSGSGWNGLAIGPLAGQVCPIIFWLDSGVSPRSPTPDSELRYAKAVMDLSLNKIAQFKWVFVQSRQIEALKRLLMEVEKSAKTAPTAEIGKAWIDAVKEVRFRILFNPKFQEALQPAFNHLVNLPRSELGAYDLVLRPEPTLVRRLVICR
ncbi:MAG: hypothetical protein Q7T03_07920 [Deltaproteobacteria bacterium]|nr:hypothetical protein [Deltaproteobacteria bacterium]